MSLQHHQLIQVKLKATPYTCKLYKQNTCIKTLKTWSCTLLFYRGVMCRCSVVQQSHWCLYKSDMGSAFNCMFHAKLGILWLLLRLVLLPKISSELKRNMWDFPLISVVEMERPMWVGVLSVDAYKLGGGGEQAMYNEGFWFLYRFTCHCTYDNPMWKSKIIWLCNLIALLHLKHCITKLPGWGLTCATQTHQTFMHPWSVHEPHT